ncbi:hypothetical protein GCM10010510_65320 [Streptomyces anandii JCM 4720]|nr:hypothetical protein GCM10010510_65320 [Streptomyces anandii JCM 4720]
MTTCRDNEGKGPQGQRPAPSDTSFDIRTRAGGTGNGPTLLWGRCAQSVGVGGFAASLGDPCTGADDG